MKVIYKEKYKDGRLRISPPMLRHMDKTVMVKDSCILEAGKYEDGTGYQIIKVNIKISELFQ